MVSPILPKDGLIAVVKADCPTCQLVIPILEQLVPKANHLAIYSQDETEPFSAINDSLHLDQTLELSYRLDIETVPTLIRFKDGAESGRIVGWHRGDWEQFTGLTDLGPNLPEWKPGCGAKNVEPHLKDQLELQFGEVSKSPLVI